MQDAMTSHWIKTPTFACACSYSDTKNGTEYVHTSTRIVTLKQRKKE